MATVSGRGVVIVNSVYISSCCVCSYALCHRSVMWLRRLVHRSRATSWVSARWKSPLVASVGRFHLGGVSSDVEPITCRLRDVPPPRGGCGWFLLCLAMMIYTLYSAEFSA